MLLGNVGLRSDFIIGSSDSTGREPWQREAYAVASSPWTLPVILQTVCAPTLSVKGSVGVVLRPPDLSRKQPISSNGFETVFTGRWSIWLAIRSAVRM